MQRLVAIAFGVAQTIAQRSGAGVYSSVIIEYTFQQSSFSFQAANSYNREWQTSHTLFKSTPFFLSYSI
jgi:hypothetical protein